MSSESGIFFTKMKENIIRNQELFDKLVSLIPQKYYKFEPEIVDLKFMKNMGQLAPKQEIKEKTKKAKKQKLDPELRKVEIENIEWEEIEIPNVKPMENSDAVVLKEKLQQRIQQLREQRGGTDPKSRQELLDKRKQKQDKRKNRKMTADTKV
jgi:hypothetical protein